MMYFGTINTAEKYILIYETNLSSLEYMARVIPLNLMLHFSFIPDLYWRKEGNKKLLNSWEKNPVY